MSGAVSGAGIWERDGWTRGAGRRARTRRGGDVKERAIVLVAVPAELPVELLGGELGEVRHVPFGRLLLHGRSVD